MLFVISVSRIESEKLVGVDDYRENVVNREDTNFFK